MFEKIFNIVPYVGAALVGIAQGILISGACFLVLKGVIYLLRNSNG